MGSYSDSLVSSTSRPLRLRRRADLVASQQRYQSRDYWVLKDPIGLQYFRLEAEEYSLLSMLNGEITLEQMRDEFETQFAPQKIDFETLGGFLADMHRKGLVYSVASGQGTQLAKRHRSHRRREWISRLARPLSIRFRGVYPQPFFNLIYPRVRWMFAPAAIACCIAIALSALLLLIVEFDEFRSRLPTFHQFFTLETSWMLLAVLGATKILHEFGHGLACKHFGGECSELGIMLLVFTPCLYCNVSDSWMLPSKWRRAAVGAAGMYVELILASLATFIWWFSIPGLLNHLALNVMFVCSVTTLAFNANPLLRYDGYYILADLLEIPNLSQKAEAVLKRFTSQLVLGIKPTQNPFLPRRHHALFGAYAVGSTVYRWVVVISVLWFLHEFFKPYRLQLITQLFASASIFALVLKPLWRLTRYLHSLARREQIKKPRIRVATALGFAAMAGLLTVPLPHRVYGTLELEPQDPQNLFVEVPGALAEVFVQPGETVDSGTVVARLENIDLELAISELTVKRDYYQAQMVSLRHRRFTDEVANSDFPEMEKTLQAFEEQLRQKQRDYERLTLRSTRTGTLLPAPDVPDQPSNDGRLATWSGSPFEARNLGCLLPESTLLCRVGDANKYEALVVLDQADMPFVTVGQIVDIKLDERPGETFSGRVDEISRVDLKISPEHLSNKRGGELATKTDESGVERPLNVSYQVRVPLVAPDAGLRTGFCGRAKLYARWESAATRVWRWLSHTFHFSL